MFKLSIIAFLGTLGACAANQGTQGTHPQDMSVAEHRAAARNEEAAAEEQLRARETTTCVPLASTRATTQSGIACWTSRSKPTPAEKAQIARNLKLAAEHRAAADALVQAEAQSCTGIDDEDRDVSLFFHREDIVAVEPATEAPAPYFGNDSSRKTNGAVIVFRAVPGLTVEWLQHVVNCHIARAAALGYDVPEMADSPLVLKNVQANVSADADTFRIAVTSDDRPTVLEIVRRAEALVGHSVPTNVPPPVR
jgi:hypothetical protein